MSLPVSVLKNCILFTSIEEMDIPHLLECIDGRRKTFQPGEFIWLSHSQVNHVGVLLSGSLELIKENPAGMKHILDFVAPSQIFGEGIVCTGNRLSPVTVAARQKSEVLFIPYDRIVRTCGNSCNFHQQIVRNMMMILGEKNSLLNRKIELLTIKGMREKLATYLLYESQKKNSLFFTIIPNRNELADYLNVSRASMCRELGRMKDEGLIDYYQNSFKILDVDRLAECLVS